MNFGHWFETLRAILEVWFFAAGVVVAIAAIMGLHQIKLTKQIATKNAKREDLKFAAERCQYFAEKVVALQVTVVEEQRKLGSTLLSQVPAKFEIVDGEIVPQFDMNLS